MKPIQLIPSVLVVWLLSACATPTVPEQSEAEIASRRASIEAMEDHDYARARRQRQDSIEDLGKMQMNEAEAINKAYENRSKQKVYIIH